MATAIQITIAEYLTTSDRPDCDFIDGELQKRNLGKRIHARTLALLAACSATTNVGGPPLC